MKEALKKISEERLTFKNMEELEKWIKENVVEKGKREIAKNPSKAFQESTIVVTDRKKPEEHSIVVKTVNVPAFPQVYLEE